MTTCKPTRREFLFRAAAMAAIGALGRPVRGAAPAGPVSAASASAGAAPGAESGASAAGSASAGPPAGRRPNIVFILADDLGYGDIGCYGCRDIRTPAIDGLAAEGVRFSQYYAAGAECTPTRTALLTGRYFHRVGGLECAIGTGNVGRYDDAVRLAAQHDLGLPAEETSIARLIKDAGYRTAVCGKWHLGYEPKFLPSRHGFDRFIGILGGNADYFHHCETDGTKVLYENDRPVERPEYLTDLITDESVAFIRAAAGAPFFLYVAYTAPHSPYQGPKDRSPAPVPKEKAEAGTRAKLIEMIEAMDAGVGKILRALDEKGLAAGTLVFFVSDNGGTGPGTNTPLSGGKGTTREGGIRVPCIARWPGVLPRGRAVETPAITMDLSVSLVAAAGARWPAGRTPDGIDILAYVRDGTAPPARPLFFRNRRGENTWRAVRDGSMKHLSRQSGEKTEQWLYDLAADAAEKNDLAAARPDEVKRLKALLAAWEKEVQPRR
ncbi:MAG: N-acetylgalactosamine-6-sulfatase [Planctomycetes bacterium]|nr:N-acetylgalactosamine-6-sulfatase [Planctomycetota bacterium]